MFKVLKAYGLWILLVIALTSYLSYALSGQAEEALMPGETTHGHFQIEMACSECHTKGMGVKQDACNRCHAEELKRVDDSHPVIKFKDPRNASRLEHLDATKCVTCHREHQPELTGEMGLTLPGDYCYFCHQGIAEERPSHAGLGFDSCATSGCHNFHDNTALYERFLVDHLDEADFKEDAVLRVRDYYDDPARRKAPLKLEDANMGERVEYTHRILHDWSTTAHAAAGVQCTYCHEVKDEARGVFEWVDRPDHNSCRNCHEHETKTFLEGRHGMRLAQGMSPMTPGMARIPMRKDAAHLEMNCMSCHGSHRFNTVSAAVDACLNCHNDEHSRAYKQSPHYTKTYLPASQGAASMGQAVSCATCHMPRVERSKFGQSFTIVDHNQNNSLRPNEKMIRSACIQCHSLQFTLNSLADEGLIRSNFNGRPSVFVDSLEMAREEKLKDEARRSGDED
ncbi:cytochrome c3 family protein [Coraliomargarita parva]|uniref:cytochrome c3 family protein n=1 Tax=Coraliomargarita parva TaxID=3014050 RepID=UPI0022B3F542|nr:cytochrome c3 family protein [Coraliomargarita parva]